MEHKVRILMTEFVTHDTQRFILEKPPGYRFVSGQATQVAINKPNWQKEKRPLTLTSLNDDLVLELTVKSYPLSKYPNHKGMTEQLHKLVPGDELIIEEPWGTIDYQGPGVFIAGGAGITPFIAILRDLQKKGEIANNTLIFSNKTRRDIILEKEFKEMFRQGGQLILTLTQEEREGYEKGRISRAFLEKHVDNFAQRFYLCGPPEMVKDVRVALKELGAQVDSIVFEK